VILIDTNVLLDVVGGDPVWGDWSRRQLNAAAVRDDTAINDIVYAELSVGYQRIEELDEMLATAGISLAPMPRPALFLAVKRFTDTAKRVVVEPACCRISSSARMRWYPMPF
jgi:predicted nucleic acid-binding protein